MKKKLFAVLASVLVLAMGSMTVFAADSETTGTALVEEGTTINGVEVTTFESVSVDPEVATVDKLTDTQKSAASTKLQAEVPSNATGLQYVAFDIVGKQTGTPITITVPGLKANKRTRVFHQLSSGAWEEMTPRVDGEKITLTFSSYSAVIIVQYDEPATTATDDDDDDTPYVTPQVLADIITGPTSPKTSEAAPFAAVVAVLALAGVAVCAKKSAVR